MQDRVITDIGAPESLQDWKAIDWQQVRKRVKNLRQRIYRATQKGEWKQVRNLQKLMMRSHANLLLSTRQVTQENAGKKTAGIDGHTAVTPSERVQLVNEMRGYTPWTVRPARRIYIPKTTGKLRPLGIPTIKDRVLQAVVKNALEPEWEAKFEANSYGFRPGRSCHDAVAQCWLRLNGNCRDTWILDADIKGAFDHICHEFILTALGNSPGRELVKQWLKAGYVEAEVWQETTSGTPQGGVISPLLANIALDGMEQWLAQHRTTRNCQNSESNDRHRVPKFGFIRYADDFVITAKSKADLTAILPEISDWLKQRGLSLNEEKTHLRQGTEGFNFLGFNIRQYQGKCLTKPQKEKIQAKLKQLKEWLKSHQNAGPEAIIRVMNPILRGWANYYKHAVSSRVFAAFDSQVVQMLLRWARRKHSTKGMRWIVARYFGRIGGNRWVFKAKTVNRQGKPGEVYLYRMTMTKITRHIKVKGGVSPDDPTLTKYWTERNARYGKTYFVPGSKLYRVAESQKWSCPVCQGMLFSGEGIHIHHVKRVADGGKEEKGNLQILHAECHRHLHGECARMKCGGLEPYDE